MQKQIWKEINSEISIFYLNNKTKRNDLLNSFSMKQSSLFCQLVYGKVSLPPPPALWNKDKSNLLTSESETKECTAEYFEAMGQENAFYTNLNDPSWLHLDSNNNLAGKIKKMAQSCWNKGLDRKTFDKVLQKAKSNTSPGPDLVQYGAIKLFSDDAKNLAYGVVYAMFSKLKIPARVKLGEIVTLLKPEDPFNLANTKGITLRTNWSALHYWLLLIQLCGKPKLCFLSRCCKKRITLHLQSFSPHTLFIMPNDMEKKFI